MWVVFDAYGAELSSGVRRISSRDSAEDNYVWKGIAPETIAAVNTASNLSRGE